jgi:hypothetical protein
MSAGADGSQGRRPWPVGVFCAERDPGGAENVITGPSRSWGDRRSQSMVSKALV